MKTLLITGQTYLLRREIRAMGGHWNNEEKGWICPVENREKIDSLSSGITIEEFESPENCFAPMTLEERRAHIQGIRNRRAERLLNSAAIRQSKAEELRTQTEPYMSDIAFVTQPITPGAGGRSFSRFRDKVYNKIDRRFGLENEADELKERAERLMAPVAMKGDAEKRKTAEREAMDKIVKVGTKVNYRLFNRGESQVIRINKKTYTIQFEDKTKFSVDKRFVSVIQ